MIFTWKLSFLTHVISFFLHAKTIGNTSKLLFANFTVFVIVRCSCIGSPNYSLFRKSTAASDLFFSSVILMDWGLLCRVTKVELCFVRDCSFSSYRSFYFLMLQFISILERGIEVLWCLEPSLLQQIVHVFTKYLLRASSVSDTAGHWRYNDEYDIPSPCSYLVYIFLDKSCIRCCCCC